jgi:Flp pilus assembly protein TadD
MVAEGRGRTAEAIRWHRLAVSKSPKDVEALVALGLALEVAGKRQESLEVLGEAMKLDPTSVIARRAFAGVTNE